MTRPFSRGPSRESKRIFWKFSPVSLSAPITPSILILRIAGEVEGSSSLFPSASGEIVISLRSGRDSGPDKIETVISMEKNAINTPRTIPRALQKLRIAEKKIDSRVKVINVLVKGRLLRRDLRGVLFFSLHNIAQMKTT